VAGWYGRTAHNNGGLVGSYNNVAANSFKSNPIYVIGSSYKPADAALSNMYGIGYTHTNAGFITDPGPNSWGMYVAADGDARIFLAASATGSSYFNAGNLGIGTTGPSQKLDVNGRIRMRTQTTSGDAADIVATKGYVDSQSSSGGGKQMFTSSGTFNVPSGVTQVWVTVVGAGGGGGGPKDGTPGTAGGSSSFGPISASGGSGGRPSSSGGSSGGSGGSSGEWSRRHMYAPTAWANLGGDGGGTVFGTGGFGGQSGYAVWERFTGDTGSGYGAGGGGAGGSNALSASVCQAGSGGGGGGVGFMEALSVTSGSSIPVTVGAAGAGGARGGCSYNGGGGFGAPGMVLVEW